MTTQANTYDLTSPYNLVLKRSQLDEQCVENQLVVETIYSAISPGTELAAYQGLPPLRETKNPYPRLVGYCNVGKIIAVSDSSKKYNVGDIVLSHASHRSTFTLAETDVLVKVPVDANLACASTTYLFHLGYSACLQAEIRPGMSVAVIGLGTLGLTSASLACHSGARVTGFSNFSSYSELHQSFGFDAILSKVPNIAKQEFDTVLTTSNKWADWQLALNLVRKGGSIVVLGFPGRGEVPPDFNPLGSQWFYDKQLTIRACGYVPDIDVDAIDFRFTLKRNCAYLLGEILGGRLPANKLISEIRPAEELDAVYQELSLDRRNGRTVVLDWTRQNI